MTRSPSAPAPGDALVSLALRRPLLVASFKEPQTMLSWAPARPGFRTSGAVAWFEVRNADLTPDVDPQALLAERLAAERLGDAVGMMTSRDVGRFRRASARRGGALADCAATVGLANAVRVGAPATSRTAAHGTVNILAAVSEPLAETGLIEALSIAVEARTAAVMDAGWRLPEGIATGTGTDCVAIAAPAGDRPQRYAGLHTGIGQAIGAAVYDAVLAGARDWIAERG